VTSVVTTTMMTTAEKSGLITGWPPMESVVPMLAR